jgi:glyoxylase-like metal-dependent hydrolase (beta-lactamase superfamily II)
MTTRWQRDVAPGVHRLEHAHTNLYLVQTDGRLLLVDTGLPRSYGPLLDAIDDLGHTPRDITAVVLTHGHFDHVGTARRLATRWDLPILAPELDRRLVAHPYRYLHENSGSAHLYGTRGRGRSWARWSVRAHSPSAACRRGRSRPSTTARRCRRASR